MNVTPLVDVVLVLLIIFMVVIPMMEKGATVELPAIAHADEDPEGPDPFTLSITEAGEMHLEEEQLGDESLAAALRAANEKEPQRKLLLRADQHVRYERARDLFRICQEIGFPGVSLRVNEQPDVPGE